MKIRLTRLTDERHAFEVEQNGRVERVELETRSTLHHDFTHFAVEETAKLDGGFFGALARGETLAELAARARDGGYAAEMMQIERAVALLQRLAKVDEDPGRLHAQLTDSAAVQGAVLPAWFSVELVRAVRERLRRLTGEWRATPFGATMELAWTRDQRHDTT